MNQDSKKQKLVLIDGNAIIHRAYHAIPKNFTTPEGEPSNAVYGFATMLLRLIEELKPTHIAVCFDRPEPTFRHKAFLDYQSQRPEVDSELISQFQKVRDLVTAFNIPYYEKPGYEADDIIGTISQKAKIEEVIIITGDRDILQLVNEKVKVFLPTKGLSTAIMMDKTQVQKKLGVFPKQIIDYKALVGDPSDNYKGVPGIGPVTAENLLEKYKNFENIYKSLDAIKPQIVEKLKKGKQSGELSKTLATIMTTVPIQFDLSDMEKWEIAGPKIQKQFQKFGFKSLPKRAEKVAKNTPSRIQPNLL